jgi:peptide/nickel transport system substrate-binding protein
VRAILVRRTLLVLAAAAVTAVVTIAPAAGLGQPAPKRGGTIVVALPSGEPPCLNVLAAACEGATTDLGVPSVLQPAYEFRPDLTTRPVLVSKADYTREPPFTLTYHIRPEARWSDDVPVTARDFVFTANAIRKSDEEEIPRIHDVISSIRAMDAKTVRVVLRRRYAGWRQLFPFVLPEHVLRGEDLTRVWTDSIDDPKTGRPIGSGPFLVGSWDRGRQITFVRNPRYWGPHTAYVGRLVVRFSDTTAERADGLRSGALTVAFGLGDAFPGLRGDPRIRLDTYPGLAAEHLELRLGPGGHAALKLKLVRQALAYGIDRVALVRQVYSGIVSNPNPLDSMVLPAQSRYYEPSFGEYRRRPAYARELLERAGCRLGDDAIYRCGGQRLKLRFVTLVGIDSRAHTLEIVQRQLRDIGVDVEPEYVPGRTLFAPGGVLESGEFDVALFAWVFSVDPSDLDTVFGCGGSQNFSGYCQRLVTADLDQADRILDARQRARVLNRAGRQIARDVPMIPLYSFVINGGHSSRLRNYVFSPDPLWRAQEWWLAPES